MKLMFMFIALLGFTPHLSVAAPPLDKGAQEFATGYDLLKQQKYQEARTTFEAGLQQNPVNAMAHFYLGDACRGLKAWACAEEHYETSIELDGKSPIVELAKQRLRKSQVWRRLEEAERKLNESDVSDLQAKQALDILEIANNLSLESEQEAVYKLLKNKAEKKVSAKAQAEREQKLAEVERNAKAELAERNKNLPSVKETLAFIKNNVKQSFSTPGSWVTKWDMKITPDNKFVYTAEGTTYDGRANANCTIGRVDSKIRHMQYTFTAPIEALVPARTSVRDKEGAEEFGLSILCGIGSCVNFMQFIQFDCRGRNLGTYPGSTRDTTQQESLRVFMGGDVVLAQKVANAFEHLFTKANLEYKQANRTDPF